MRVGATARLHELLVEEGLVPEAAATTLSQESNGDVQALLGLLASRYQVPPSPLARLLSRLYGLPAWDGGAPPVAAELLARFPPETCRRRGFVPLRLPEGGVGVALVDPGNLPLLDALRRALPGPLPCYVTPRATLEAALAAATGAPGTLALLEEDLPAALAAEGPAEPSYALEASRGETAPPIIRLVDTLLRNALAARASDIHLEGSEQGVAVKYRIDGMLYPVGPPLPRAYQEPVISRLKVMAELDIAEHRLPQDGRFKLRREAGPPVDCRLSLLPSAFGEGAVIRILDKAALTAELQELKLERLGFPAPDLARFRRHLVKPYGLILVTGPTGSGKTTTLYAALTEIHTGQDKIVTIEDPIEYQLKGVLQMPVNEKKGLTFARGLRSILRHDPDKIMVGEIRDPETAQIAVQAALTGHLVFTTVHANNAVDVVGRLLHMGLDPYNFVAALSCILPQRLVRLICPGCRAPLSLSPDALATAGLPPAAWQGAPLFHGRGCPACHGTGYLGRTGIFELVEVTDRFREAILARRPGGELRSAAAAAGTTFLREAALEKVRAGHTTVAEANRVTVAE